MFKTRIILFVIAIGLTLLIFTLPRTVVKNPPEINDPEPITSENISEGSLVFSQEEQQKISFLTENFQNSTNKEKSAIFADSLANLYAEKGLYDSAATYFGWIAENMNNIPAALQAGNFYYEAFETALSKEQADSYGSKARKYLEQYLQQDPKNADAKAKVAMTYVATENAMQGIAMLREVVEEHPENEAALFNLGVLSVQSGQFDKAIERFEKLIEVNPHHVNAHFYMGISHMELKNKEAAREYFSRTKTLSKDPSIHAAVDNYMEKLK